MRINTRDRDPRPADNLPPGPSQGGIEKINGPGGIDKNDYVDGMQVRAIVQSPARCCTGNHYITLRIV